MNERMDKWGLEFYEAEPLRYLADQIDFSRRDQIGYFTFSAQRMLDNLIGYGSGFWKLNDHHALKGHFVDGAVKHYMKIWEQENEQAA